MEKTILLIFSLLLLICCHNNIKEIDQYSLETASKIKSLNLQSLEISEKTCGGNSVIFFDNDNLVAFYNENGGEGFETMDIFFVKDNKIIKIERTVFTNRSQKRILYYIPEKEIKDNSLDENYFGYSDEQIYDCGSQIVQQFKK